MADCRLHRLWCLALGGRKLGLSHPQASRLHLATIELRERSTDGSVAVAADLSDEVDNRGLKSWFEDIAEAAVEHGVTIVGTEIGPAEDS